MMEVEVFQRNPDSRIHVLKLWHGDMLVYENELCTEHELMELKESLSNELLWLEDYIRLKGIDSGK